MVDLVEAGELLLHVRARPVTGAVEHGKVFQHAGVVQHHGKHSGVGVGPMRRRIGQRRLQGCVLREAVAELLEIEDAAGLVHSLSRALDRRKQGQNAGDEDAGGHGKVGPAERKREWRRARAA